MNSNTWDILYLRKVFHLTNSKSHQLPQLGHQEMLLNYVCSLAWLHTVPDLIPILQPQAAKMLQTIYPDQIRCQQNQLLTIVQKDMWTQFLTLNCHMLSHYPHSRPKPKEIPYCHCTSTGNFPTNDKRLLPYFPNRHHLTTINGLLMFKDKIVLLQTLRLDIPTLAHEGQQGVVRTKQRNVPNYGGLAWTHLQKSSSTMP